MLLIDETDEDDGDNRFRFIEVARTVMLEALEDPAAWDWLENILDRRVTNARYRELLRLPPLSPFPRPRPGAKIIAFHEAQPRRHRTA
jgi:hypothetical protein